MTRVPAAPASKPVPAPRRRLARRVAVAAVVAGGAASLVACQKPLPDVTFQSGSRSVLVSPANYCFDVTDRNTCRGEGGVATLRAAPGAQINISVPRSVADNAWIASAEYTDANGKNQVIDGVGSNLVVDNHHAAVPVPNLGVASYLLTVTEFRGTTATGAWTVQVDVEN